MPEPLYVGGTKKGRTTSDSAFLPFALSPAPWRQKNAEIPTLLSPHNDLGRIAEGGKDIRVAPFPCRPIHIPECHPTRGGFPPEEIRPAVTFKVSYAHDALFESSKIARTHALRVICLSGRNRHNGSGPFFAGLHQVENKH
jgi:hypothetical protein